MKLKNPLKLDIPRRSAGTGGRLQTLIVALVLLLALDAVIVWYDARQATFGTIYIEVAGKIRMLSQRLAKAAQQASEGNVEAFKQLRESRDEFAARMKLLLMGGQSAGVDLPATSAQVRPVLDEVFPPGSSSLTYLATVYRTRVMRLARRTLTR